MKPVVSVVGSGPNGLAAALVLQRSGCAVTLYERNEVLGGGLATAELTRRGQLHDSCAAVHPLALASPLFRAIGLEVEWVHPAHALAHPMGDGTAVLVSRSLQETAEQLGGRDGRAYLRMLGPLVAEWPELAAEILAPPHVPRLARAYGLFAMRAARSAAGLARSTFREERGRALFAGLAAHGTLPLNLPPSAAFGLVLAACAHAAGWPIVRGGSARVAEALAAEYGAAGGEVRPGQRVDSLSELRRRGAVVLDVSPREVERLAGAGLGSRGRRQALAFRHGCGVHKVDWLLSEPVPWRAPGCAHAGTLHLGSSLAEIAAALKAANAGGMTERPFVLCGQPTQFDRSRATAGAHHAWGYCCVPAGSDTDFTPLLEAQVERFAPGFRDVVVARHVRTARALEQYNPNLVGGSLAGAARSPLGFFLGPFLSLRSPYLTPMRGVYLCSAVTPPGPGVHGMCGFHAARRVLRDLAKTGADLFTDPALSIL